MNPLITLRMAAVRPPGKPYEWEYFLWAEVDGKPLLLEQVVS